MISNVEQNPLFAQNWPRLSESANTIANQPITCVWPSNTSERLQTQSHYLLVASGRSSEALQLQARNLPILAEFRLGICRFLWVKNVWVPRPRIRKLRCVPVIYVHECSVVMEKAKVASRGKVGLEKGSEGKEDLEDSAMCQGQQGQCPQREQEVFGWLKAMPWMN